MLIFLYVLLSFVLYLGTGISITCVIIKFNMEQYFPEPLYLHNGFNRGLIIWLWPIFFGFHVVYFFAVGIVFLADKLCPPKKN